MSTVKKPKQTDSQLNGGAEESSTCRDYDFPSLLAFERDNSESSAASHEIRLADLSRSHKLPASLLNRFLSTDF